MKALRKIKRHYHRVKNHPLTSEETYMAMLRYISFNIKSSFVEEQVKLWLDGLKLYLRKGDAGLVGNWYYGLYEFEESIFLLHFLNENDLFLDVGANLGHYSLLISGIRRCKSIAVEPVPATYEQLLRNIELNDLGDVVEAYQIGVGEKEAVLNFSKDRNTMDRIVASDYIKVVEVPITTIDSLIDLRIPSALKLDIEGYEFFALKGASRVLNSPELKVIVLELNKSGEKYGVEDDTIFQLLLNYGFKPFEYNVKTRKLVELKSYNSQKFNTLFIRDLGYVEKRVRASSKIDIRKKQF